MRLVRESTRLSPRPRSQRFHITTTIITLPTISILYGLEALRSCRRKHTLVRLSSPRTFEARSTQRSGVGAGCSNRLQKSGLRNSRPRTTARSTLEKQQSASLPHSHTVKMNQASDGYYLALSKSQVKESSSRLTFRGLSRKRRSRSYLTRSPVS